MIYFFFNIFIEKIKNPKKIAEELLINAENFIINIKVLINKLNNDIVEDIRQKFEII